eukprot:gb/GECG01004259.1/.p1 GENE.gb/GECG01004259.1/~~gb/GECG01004259.1/.p1  ORF type:complete len:515 (+),score=44.08 gb/GECG01004259.1/:1-1545(+)
MCFIVSVGLVLLGIWTPQLTIATPFRGFSSKLERDLNHQVPLDQMKAFISARRDDTPLTGKWPQLERYKDITSIEQLADMAGTHPSDFVDTRIGTGGFGYGLAALPPGPQIPFGALRLGPDTSLGLEPFKIPFDHNGGYYYYDDFIEAFSHTHMVGSGVQDFGNFGVMVSRRPFNSSLISDSNYKSRFSHKNETAFPGYYFVSLLDAGPTAELAVSGGHAGIHRYNCTGEEPCNLILDVCHTVMGQNAKNCPNASLETKMEETHVMISKAYILSSGSLSERSPVGGIQTWAYVRVEAHSLESGELVSILPFFWLEGNTGIGTTSINITNAGSLGSAAVTSFGSSVVFTVRTGISYCSAENAEKNLLHEQYSNASATWVPFEECTSAVVTLWDSVISRVGVQPVSDSTMEEASKSLTKVYTAVYHSYLSPTSYTEWDGEYPGFDGRVHHWPWWNPRNESSHCSLGKLNQRCLEDLIPNSAFVSDLSLWDTHRTQAPWLTLSFPDRALDTVNPWLL